jgi:hypothetical protein
MFDSLEVKILAPSIAWFGRLVSPMHAKVTTHVLLGVKRHRLPCWKQWRWRATKVASKPLAEMIGTTRSRVSFFMNRFRKLGFIDYHAGDELQVHSSLLNIVLHD